MDAAAQVPFVSVVIPTRDGHEPLRECVGSLLAQDYPADRYEVIVVDNPPSERTAALVSELAAGDRQPELRYLSLPAPDANAARNAGIEASRGDPVCLVDDDSVAPPGWLRALVAGVGRHPGAGCVGGPVRARFEHLPPRTCAHHELAGTSFEAGPEDAEVRLVWGANMAIPRAALERVGPFAAGLTITQEREWEHRLRAGGGRVVYVPDAWLWHRRFREDLVVRHLLLRFFRAGVAIGRYERRQGAGARPAHIALMVARTGRWMWHGLRCRCTRGLTDAARCAGIAVGALPSRAR